MVRKLVVFIPLVLALFLVSAGGAPEPLINDAFLSPDAGAAQRTSEYMIGPVAVGILLPDSDGGSEDWTKEEVDRVESEIGAAMDWWAVREPKANVSFVHELLLLTTSYEPIERPHTDQGLWIREIMEQLGYSGPSYFTSVRSYNEDLAERKQTDHAFTIFVVDSSADWDDSFADGYFAYAYLGGPFMVMTLGNDGYGQDDMDMVAAHEIGHVFRALDQMGVPCSHRSGCALVPNRNSSVPPGCVDPEPSIMKWAPSAYPHGFVDKWARGQVGWWDYDMDGIFDCVDDYVGEPRKVLLPVIMKGAK